MAYRSNIKRRRVVIVEDFSQLKREVRKVEILKEGQSSSTVQHASEIQIAMSDSSPPIDVGSKTTNYSNKRDALELAWQNQRQPMQRSFVESLYVPVGSKCCFCQMSMEGVIIGCCDCWPNVYYCQLCCERIHAVVKFHKPQIWKVIHNHITQ
jgi:hypothetical protein